MPHQSTLYRRIQKKESPEKYKEYLKRHREGEKKRIKEAQQRWEEEPHTKAQVEEMEAKKKAKRERAHAQYMARKLEGMRQTRNTNGLAATPVPSAEKKRLKDMTPDEFRAYHAEKTRNRRALMTHQKKSAIKRRDRQTHRERREKERKQRTGNNVSPALTASIMRQSVYNLNYDYKVKAKQLGMSPQENAQSTLNLRKPKTPEKMEAILVQEKARHVPFDPEEDEKVQLPVEEELGIEVMDFPHEGPCMEETVTKPLHEKIQIFYCRDEVSRMLPNSQNTTKHGAARIMCMTLKAAHSLFNEQVPGVTVGLTMFQSLRPKNVRLSGSVPLESCLCIYCTNIRLKIVALNELLGSSGQLPNENVMLKFLTCIFDGKWPDIKCIDGDCPLCADKIRPFKIFCRDINRSAVKWQRWENNSGGKVKPNEKDGIVSDLIEELHKDLFPLKRTNFLQHLFTAFWQYSQFEANKTNPEEGEVVMVQDFGENLKAAYSAEIKSKQQITVHPVVCFFRSGEAVVRQSIIFLTDDIIHDHHAVNTFTEKSLEILRPKINMSKLTMWSDGAASQYKGKGTFHDLSFMPLASQKCFYGSEHGKGEADGETSVMCQALKRATYEGKSFRNAEDMAAFLSTQYGNDKRQYVLVEAIDRVETDDTVQTIPGTRKYHQFQKIGEYVVRARRLACFCCACRESKFDRCINRDIVGEFITHKLKPSPERTIVRVGDYVKLKCLVKIVEKTFYAVVIHTPEDASNFSVKFLSRNGSAYMFHDEEDVELIASGPPDFYTWEVLEATSVSVDNRGHYFFKV